MSHTENTPLLEVRNLKKYFGKKDRVLHAVDDISVTIQQGKTLGVVGESGCWSLLTDRSSLTDRISPMSVSVRCANTASPCRSSFRIPTPA